MFRPKWLHLNGHQHGLQVGKHNCVKWSSVSLCWSIQIAKDRYKYHIDGQLTRPSVDGNMVMVCQCRRDMRWNERALECQVLFAWCWYRGKQNFCYNIQWDKLDWIVTILFEEFHFPLFQLYLDVDCTNLTYMSEVSPGQLWYVSGLAWGLSAAFCARATADVDSGVWWSIVKDEFVNHKRCLLLPRNWSKEEEAGRQMRTKGWRSSTFLMWTELSSTILTCSTFPIRLTCHCAPK